MPITAIPKFGSGGFSDTGVGSGYGTVGINEWDFDKALIPGLDADKFASSKSTLIAAGPPRIVRDAASRDADDQTGNTEDAAISEDYTPAITDGLAQRLRLIGLVQDFNLSQNRGMSEIPEIGSRAIYYMSGRTSRRVTLSKVLFHGASLLRAMYENANVNFDEIQGQGSYEQLPASAEAAALYINLESRFFERPCGLFVRFSTLGAANNIEGDTEDATDAANVGNIGGIYLEECMISAHSIATNANNTIIAENVAVTCRSIVPISDAATG